jgi:hypothetical protein
MGHRNIEHVEDVEGVFEDATANACIPDLPKNFLSKYGASLPLALRIGDIT